MRTFLEFKTWLLSEVKKNYNKTYDAVWRPRFDALPRAKHFAHLFPPGQDRLYIPLTVPASDFPTDSLHDSQRFRDRIQQALAAANATVHDWGKGTAAVRQPGRTQTQVTTIGRVLRRADPALAKEFDEWGQTRYGGVRINPKRNEYVVIISQDPHDIAKQSTGRMWDSCNTLPFAIPEGEPDWDYKARSREPGEEVDFDPWYTFKKLAREVMDGGLIAYLCEKDDRDVRNPIARINLKRYEDPVKGESILFCSDSYLVAYGKTAVSGFFVKTVRKWFTEAQSFEKIVGHFKKKGGTGVDGNPYDVDLFPDTPITPQLEDYYEKAIRYYSEHDPYYAAKFVSRACAAVASQTEWGVSDRFWGFLKPYVFSDSDHACPHTLRAIYQKFPDEVSLDDLLKLSRTTLNKFLGRGLSGGRDPESQQIADAVVARAQGNILTMTRKPPTEESASEVIRLFGIMSSNKFLKEHIKTLWAWMTRAALALPGERLKVVEFVLEYRYHSWDLDLPVYAALSNQFLDAVVPAMSPREVFDVRFEINPYLNWLAERRLPPPDSIDALDEKQKAGREVA